MPFHWFEVLRSLSTSQTPRLLTTLLACGIALFLGGRGAWQVWVFAALRLAVITLAAPLTGIALTTVSLISWVAMLIVMTVSGARPRPKVQHPDALGTIASGPPSLIFRSLTAAGAVFVTHVLMQRIHLPRITYSVSWTVIWLLVSGSLLWLLWRSPLQAGWLTLMLSDAGRVLYALWQPDIWAWGLWSVCDVLVIWVAVYLGQPGDTPVLGSMPGDVQ